MTCYVKNGTVTILEFYPICEHEGQVRQSQSVPPPFYRMDPQSLKLLLGCAYSNESITGCIYGKNHSDCRQRGCRLFNIR